MRRVVGNLDPEGNGFLLRLDLVVDTGDLTVEGLPGVGRHLHAHGLALAERGGVDLKGFPLGINAPHVGDAEEHLGGVDGLAEGDVAVHDDAGARRPQGEEPRAGRLCPAFPAVRRRLQADDAQAVFDAGDFHVDAADLRFLLQQHALGANAALDEIPEARQVGGGELQAVAGLQQFGLQFGLQLLQGSAAQLGQRLALLHRIADVAGDPRHLAGHTAADRRHQVGNGSDDAVDGHRFLDHVRLDAGGLQTEALRLLGGECDAFREVLFVFVVIIVVRSLRRLVGRVVSVRLKAGARQGAARLLPEREPLLRTGIADEQQSRGDQQQTRQDDNRNVFGHFFS